MKLLEGIYIPPFVFTHSSEDIRVNPTELSGCIEFFHQCSVVTSKLNISNIMSSFEETWAILRELELYLNVSNTCIGFSSFFSVPLQSLIII
ncbi:hypothetical protein CRM22_003469, partial [Opisthorchis felineus]